MPTALVGYYDYDSLRLRYRANAAPAALDAYVLYEQPGEPGKAYKDAIPSVTSFTTDWTEQPLEGDPAGERRGRGRRRRDHAGGGVVVRHPRRPRCELRDEHGPVRQIHGGRRDRDRALRGCRLRGHNHRGHAQGRRGGPCG